MIECAGAKFEQAIETRAQAMGRTYLAAFAATNHSPLEFFAHEFVLIVSLI